MEGALPFLGHPINFDFQVRKTDPPCVSAFSPAPILHGVAIGLCSNADTDD